MSLTSWGSFWTVPRCLWRTRHESDVALRSTPRLLSLPPACCTSQAGDSLPATPTRTLQSDFVQPASLHYVYTYVLFMFILCRIDPFASSAFLSVYSNNNLRFQSCFENVEECYFIVDNSAIQCVTEDVMLTVRKLHNRTGRCQQSAH